MVLVFVELTEAFGRGIADWPAAIRRGLNCTDFRFVGFLDDLAKGGSNDSRFSLEFSMVASNSLFFLVRNSLAAFKSSLSFNDSAKDDSNILIFFFKGTDGSNSNLHSRNSLAAFRSSLSFNDSAKDDSNILIFSFKGANGLLLGVKNGVSPSPIVGGSNEVVRFFLELASNIPS